MRSSKITRNIICSRRINIIAIIFIHRIEFLSRVLLHFSFRFLLLRSITSIDWFNHFNRAWEFVSREKKKKFFFHRSPNFPTRRRDDSRVRAEEYLNCHLAVWPSDSQFTIIAVTDKSLIISSFNRFKLVSSKFEERGDLGKEKTRLVFLIFIAINRRPSKDLYKRQFD